VAHERNAIGMSPGEVREFLGRGRIMTTATFSADGSIHLMPMWYAFVDGYPVMWTNGRSQKIVNLRRDPRVTVMVELGEAYLDLVGVQVVGRTELIEDQAKVLEIGRLVADRYGQLVTNDVLEYQATKRVGIRIVAERVVSWDHSKFLLAD